MAKYHALSVGLVAECDHSCSYIANETDTWAAKT